MFPFQDPMVRKMEMTVECVVLKALWGAKDRNPLATTEKGGDLFKVEWWCLRTEGQNVLPDLLLWGGTRDHR